MHLCIKITAIRLSCMCTIIIFTMVNNALAQIQLSDYNVIWTSQSKNSAESMPCGGGDIGLNVWVENGDVLFYVSRSGTFDENNTFLKLGRVRIKLTPNPFNNKNFRQELLLKEGYVQISGNGNGISATINIWVNVFKPDVHIDISSNKPLVCESIYESWRYENRTLLPGENFTSSLKWGPYKNVITQKDRIDFWNKGVMFVHRNMDSTVFDLTVRQQGMVHVKDSIFNPLKNLTFGGYMKGENMAPSGITNGKYCDTYYKGWGIKSINPTKRTQIKLSFLTKQEKNFENWISELRRSWDAREDYLLEKEKTIKWWESFWDRSCIMGSESIFRNYTLFRYMLGCNAYGDYPTKFNGGQFTVDPVFTDTSKHFTPDYRNWCGGVMTAQNQRLVYFPMIKSGDFDMLPSQFKFYTRSLQNAELRSKVYWGHKGACFTEQLENFGLPNSAEYGWKRPDWFDKGVEYNAWLEYEWDTVLEFCLMMLELERYTGADISEYIPFINSCLAFFNEHYQYLAQRRGAKTFDSNGHLVLYPGSGAETFKMAYNSTSTIAALVTILKRMLELPEKYLTIQERSACELMLKRIPPINYRYFGAHKTLSPAKLWERINNTEPSQLYPVFPWGIYGVGKPDLDIAINTWKYDTLALKFRSHVGWKQDNIWAARLGLTEEAKRLALLKLGDSGRRFPTFWGPGFDWVPDHNWGGSGMIGLQEMLLQVDGNKIYLFPAWPKEWDVHFKLHAPYNTTVEGILKNGKLEFLKVLPLNREKDVINMLVN